MPHFAKPFFRNARNAWFVQVGKRQINLGSDQKAAFAEYHRLMASTGRVAVDSKLTAHELCDLFLDFVKRHRKPATYDWYLNYLQSFSDQHGSVNARKILPLHVSTWLDAHPAWGQSTRRGGIVAVKRCWAWAKEEGRLEANPISIMKRPKQTRRKVMTEEGSRVILDAMPAGPLRDFIDAMITTGCRPGELTSLGASQIDFERSSMIVDGKSGKRSVILTERAIEIMRRLAAANPSGALFRNTRDQPWNRNSLRCAFRRIRSKTGIEGAVPYAFRHLFGSLAIERGVDSLLVAELMGHKDVSMLQEHYAHHKAETLRRAAEKATGAGDDAKPS